MERNCQEIRPEIGEELSGGIRPEIGEELSGDKTRY